MKKVVRLTESDLNRIVKKVLREQTQPQTPDKAVMDCFMSVMSLKDMTKIPQSCMKVGIKVMTEKTPPDFVTGMACATELSKVIAKDPMYAMGKLMEVGQCLMGKAAGGQSPVMY